MKYTNEIKQLLKDYENKDAKGVHRIADKLNVFGLSDSLMEENMNKSDAFEAMDLVQSISLLKYDEMENDIVGLMLTVAPEMYDGYRKAKVDEATGLND